MIYIGDNIYHREERVLFASWVDVKKLKGNDANCPAAKFAKAQEKIAEQKKDIQKKQAELNANILKAAEANEANRLQNEKNRLLDEQKITLIRKNLTTSGIIY